MKKKVLIVEDEAIVARDIQQMLYKNGYEVAGIANTVSKALKIFNLSKVDLVLCDIKLGKGSSGIDLIKKLKSINDKVKVIFLSAYSDENTIGEAFETNPNSYITKPFTEEQLIVTIKRVLSHMVSNNISNSKSSPTKREIQIIHYVAEGLTSRQIATKLSISFETVQTHRKNLLHKYKLNSSAELIAYSLKSKWID